MNKDVIYNPDISSVKESENYKREEAAKKENESAWQRFVNFFTNGRTRFALGIIFLLFGIYLLIAFLSFIFGAGAQDQNRELYYSAMENARSPEQIHNAEEWDLMIPQSLIPDGEHIPQLYLDYEYDQVNPYTGQMEHNHSQFPINLETINVKNSDGCITSWEPGKQYTYEIHIRLGGGITVNVSVTDWQEIFAETPGLTIS